MIRPEDEEEIRGLNLPVLFAFGGETRQDSVLNGLRALPEGARYVLVHDAARPLVSRDVIQRCTNSVMEKGSGVAAVPVTDTIKKADESGLVTGLKKGKAKITVMTYNRKKATIKVIVVE